MVAGRRRKIAQFHGTIQLSKLSAGNPLNRPETTAWLPAMKAFGFRAPKRLDH